MRENYFDPTPATPDGWDPTPREIPASLVEKSHVAPGQVFIDLGHIARQGDFEQPVDTSPAE